MTHRSAFVLFAHGARDPAWALPLQRLAQLIETRSPATTVRTSFLELQQPSLDEVIDALAPTHHTVIVVPIFWAAAGHVQQSLPAMLAAARARHPALHVFCLPVLSELPGLLEHVTDAALALARQADDPHRS